MSDSKFVELQTELRKSVAKATRVGDVIFWLPSKKGGKYDIDEKLPDGFEICDGGPVEDQRSELKGKKPDLVGHFIVGVVRNEAGRFGGANQVKMTVGIEQITQLVKREDGGDNHPSLVFFKEGRDKSTKQFPVMSAGKETHDNRPQWRGVVPLIRVR